MLDKCLHSKAQNMNESFDGMICNRVPRVTHVGLHVLSVGVYDAIAYCNKSEGTVFDILELIKISQGYYVTKYSRSVNMRRKSSSIYTMSELQIKLRKVLRHSKEKQQDRSIEKLNESHMKWRAFTIQ